LALVHESVEDLIKTEYSKLWDGDAKSLANLPIESLMPILFLKHMGSMAKTFEVQTDFIEYGYDPESTFGRGKPSVKKQSMLKEIESEFSV